MVLVVTEDFAWRLDDLGVGKRNMPLVWVVGGERIVAGLVLSIVLFQVPDPGLYRIRGTRGFKWYVAAVSLCTLFYVVVTPESWIYTVLLWVRPSRCCS